MQEREWYEVENISAIDSPALLIYADKVRKNIQKAIEIVGDLSRFRPHVKTHKSLEVTKLMIDAGIHKFKCSTIAEAEMLAIAGAKDILLSYQPIGPKAERLVALMKKYPVSFSCLVDNEGVLQSFWRLVQKENVTISLYVDLNVGMNRTGIAPGEALELYKKGALLNGIKMAGLHVYDGHIRDQDLDVRTKNCMESFAPVAKLAREIEESGLGRPVIVAGGSPTFPIHAKQQVECSPGTFIFWDKGYSDLLPEQDFLFAALVLTRVISLPAPNLICVDLGHKSIASENEITKRVYFLNAEDVKPVSQSEEHLVLDAGANHSFKIGDVLYGVPHHICPTCALYEKSTVIENGQKVAEWSVAARVRTINI